jgi:hypothetical protein
VKTKNKEAIVNPERKTDDRIAEAMKAYGIKKEFVLGSAFDQTNKEAVIVTVGGVKVRYRKGAKVNKLKYVDITGKRKTE